jgi:hypothetical protein
VYAGKPEMADINSSRHRLLNEVGSGSIREGLEFAMGKSFADIVLTCLSAGDQEETLDEEKEEDGEESDKEDDDDRCIDLELDILEKLRGCKL